ncbi:hypothetical protein ACKUT9_14000 [Mycobacterium seoulense]|uniref:hypothetical protein n=1 Tax=Mycobacterium seoulense TaxID=386911 RepID=UPI003CE9C43B
MRCYEPLSFRQVEVLQWISEGCPDGVWPDFTYKTTAYALAARNLVKVDRHRKRWSATITKDGEFYLAHGHYSTDLASAGAKSATTEIGAKTDDSVGNLLAELTSGDGQVIVASPSEPQRARYRRAIRRLITGHQIPEGFVLRHTGRSHGDLTIRLVREADQPRSEPAPRVLVPQATNEVSAEVRELGCRVRMAVTEASIERALRILQAIANECATRGWTLEGEPTDDRRFRISTIECHFELALSEELVDRDIPDAQQLSAAKYAWQRIPLHGTKVGSGRLTLQLGQYYRRKSWSDRRRWTLEDKLGAAFAEVERQVAEAAQQRQCRDEDLLRRQQEWDAAVLIAKQDFVVDLNRRRLREQVVNHAEAQAFRDYARTLNTLAEGREDPMEAEPIRRWLQWATTEADRIDPINNLADLHYLEPDAVGPDDYDPFMPRGMSAHRRPTQ